jgi:hypothetical protein
MGVTRRPDVELELEELVLHGFPAADRGRIRAAVERALAARIAEGGLPRELAGGGALARLDGGRFAVERDASPESIGARVAEAIVASAGGSGGR